MSTRKNTVLGCPGGRDGALALFLRATLADWRAALTRDQSGVQQQANTD